MSLHRYEKSWTDKIAKYLPDAIAEGMKFPVNAVIFADRNNGTIVKRDNAARITDKENNEVYVLDKEGVKTEPVEYQDLYTGKNGESWVFLRSPAKGRYIPVDYDMSEDKFDVGDSNWDMWATNQSMQERQSWEQEKGWLAENKELVSLLMLGFAGMLMFIGMGWALKQVLGSLNQSSQVLAEAAKQMAKSSAAAP